MSYECILIRKHTIALPSADTRAVCVCGTHVQLRDPDQHCGHRKGAGPAAGEMGVTVRVCVGVGECVFVCVYVSEFVCVHSFGLACGHACALRKRLLTFSLHN